MYKFLIFVGLQALYLQNTYSQAIDYPIDTVTEIAAESLDSLINLSTSDKEPTVVNQPQPQPICTPCGRPAHLCDCGRRLEVIVSDGYSNVANQTKEETQEICPHCGLSAELCNCGSLPEVVTETSVTDESKNQTVCPYCGLSAELCNCGSLPEVVTETSVTDESKNQTVCPYCGLSAELCNCGSLPEVVTETSVTDESKNQTVCPHCGLAAELCNCGFFPLVTVTEAPIEVNLPHSDSVSEDVVNETLALGQPDETQSMCPICGLPVEQCTCE